jgi:hypothetical protein
MQLPVAFNIDPEVLSTDSAPSDRFVYAPTFVSYDPFVLGEVVLLPLLQLDFLAAVALQVPPDELDREWVARYPGLAQRIEDFQGAQDQLRRARREDDAALRALRDAHERLAGISRELLEASESDAGVETKGIGAKLAAVAESVSFAETSTPAPTRTVGPQPPPGQAFVGPSNAAISLATELAALAESKLGFLFLDRTRIRPIGFALGEHVHSMSLAPGEEITLEEHVYSKRETSFEQASEQEQTFDTEMSSTLTTELTEGMNSERSRTGSDTNTMGANVGGNIDGITFNIGPSSSSSLQQADRISTTQSVKNSQAASSKVAARNRSLHKIVYKVSTENRLETTAKRIIRNPNANTPIDLEYFKVMQRLQLSHERYGVRLCWAPSIPHPGADFLARLDQLRQAIYDRAAAATAGPRPAAPNQPSQNAVPPQEQSDAVTATQFDPVWGGQSHDYEVTLVASPGFEYVPDSATVTFSFDQARPGGAFLQSATPTGNTLRVVVHVGVVDARNPLMWFDPKLRPFFGEPNGTLTFTVAAQFAVALSPGADDAYNSALADYRQQLATWEAADRQAKADALQAADEEWAARLSDALAKLNPMNEALGTLIRGFFFSDLHRAVWPWEIDLWEDLFDWKNAGLRLYPSWWANEDPRDPKAPPTDFINASWARLFLPIQPGAETAALRWIYDKTRAEGRNGTERLIAQVVGELDDYRTVSFGETNEIVVGEPAADGECPPITERYLCLGRWKETLPTDGTHIEVLQATTSAADDYSQAALEDAGKLREERIKQVESENALRDKAATDFGTVKTTIDIDVGQDPDDQ